MKYGRVEQPAIDSNKCGYPILTPDGVRVINTVKINYNEQNSQKFYKINDSEWKKYDNEEITLNIGDCIYAKEISESGAESVVTSYTYEERKNAIGKEAYDGNSDTYYENASNEGDDFIMYIDKSMRGRNVKIKASMSDQHRNLYFADSFSIIQTMHFGGEQTFKVPEKATMLVSRYKYLYLYEVQPVD